MRLRNLIALLGLVGGPLACAAPAHAVAGGIAATSGTSPWQVAVVASTTSQQWLCGGTLVARDVVLTAAHCMIDDDGRVVRPAAVYVLSGNVDLADSVFTTVTGVSLYPALRMDTPSGVPSGDLALIHLAAAAPAPAAPLAVVGPSEAALWAPGRSLRIAGWGLSSADETTAEQLLRVGTVARIADTGCASALGADFRADTMLCAGTTSDAADTCSGDSGSPIIAPVRTPADASLPSDWRVVGVTSWGEATCGGGHTPGTYARLGAADLAAFATDTTPVWAPVRVVRPSLPARAATGDAVTCDPGTWTGTDVTFAYEFRRAHADGTSTVVQTGASDRYVVTPQDAAGVICIALAHNAGGTAWSQSLTMPVDAAVATSADPVVPASAPVAQTGGGDIPRADVPVGITIPAGEDTVSGQVVSTPVDAADPRTAGARASCAHRRCTLSVLVIDAAPSSGIRRVSAVLGWSQRCTRNGRTTTCAKTARLAFRKGSDGRWSARTPRMPRGTRALARITAVDKSGRLQASPTRLSLTVR